ncbi:hypothetical protein RRG08_045550 [Elysia crispata]|uniref:Uncharacterized protein n=1 Tax=Elysia crispata TaxID=231223 RepID=A0AAE1AEQ2_9GAST|nr:hypothetical protein RRG08_045550 [Elysia crispata]
MKVLLSSCTKTFEGFHTLYCVNSNLVSTRLWSHVPNIQQKTMPNLCCCIAPQLPVESTLGKGHYTSGGPNAWNSLNGAKSIDLHLLSTTGRKLAAHKGCYSITGQLNKEWLSQRLRYPKKITMAQVWVTQLKIGQDEFKDVNNNAPVCKHPALKTVLCFVIFSTRASDKRRATFTYLRQPTEQPLPISVSQQSNLYLSPSANRATFTYLRQPTEQPLPISVSQQSNLYLSPSANRATFTYLRQPTEQPLPISVSQQSNLYLSPSANRATFTYLRQPTEQPLPISVSQQSNLYLSPSANRATFTYLRQPTEQPLPISVSQQSNLCLSPSANRATFTYLRQPTEQPLPISVSQQSNLYLSPSANRATFAYLRQPTDRSMGSCSL